MSERSSFVTEYVHCDECWNIIKSALLVDDPDKYLTAVQVPGLPIIAGKIGSSWPMGEVVTLADMFEDMPCHPVRIAILHDCGCATICTITPEGIISQSS